MGRRGLERAAVAKQRFILCLSPSRSGVQTHSHISPTRPNTLYTAPVFSSCCCQGLRRPCRCLAFSLAKRTMAASSSSSRLLFLLLSLLLQGLQSLKDYHNIFCGKENCYDLLGVPQVSV